VTRKVNRMDALVVAANRLPVEIGAEGQFAASPGGLASALSSVLGDGSQWVGWAGPDSQCDEVFEHAGMRLHPVQLSDEEVARYYRGFSNAVLWPLFHGRLRKVELNRAWWRSYRLVNERFAAAVCNITPLGGTVWLHDYHLLLVPAAIRAVRPDVRVGLFLHIPFPNAQLFSMLPWRRDLITGMLGADLIGFQVDDDAANFVAAAERLVDVSVRGNTLFDGSHAVEAGTFPISVDFELWDTLGTKAAAAAQTLRDELGVASIFLGIDRLDYTKGIAQRLYAFGELLDEGRLDNEQCAFVQVAVPSRCEVPAYQAERSDVEELIEKINSRHRRRDGSLPVHYIDSTLDEQAMAAWYRAADALVVTSLADGMNLVAKEFVAARGDLGGVLILSEFAGAAQDLDDALIVNPYDIEAIKRALVSALAMRAPARAKRMVAMRAAVKHNDVHRWARSFLGRLTATRARSLDSAAHFEGGMLAGSRPGRWQL
jgi:trehalose 6-phosphate synthase